MTIRGQQPAGAELKKVPVGTGSRVTILGILGAVAAFLTAWAQSGLNGDTIALGVTAGGVLASFFIGRSAQAAALYREVSPYIATAQKTIDDNLTPPQGS